ncbi:MAG TPA: ABC transporter permease [Bryobacteraceae bacterium]|jgi:putative ABC transport system permease protein|nr:ABC transporter permease [Bryobacteraceae bacterium]
MNRQWLLFARLILRPVLREPVRAALTVFAVALGVGLVVAIDLAAQAAAGSFHSSLESLTGKSNLLITATGGLDEAWLGRLVQLPYAFDFAPRIEDFASIDGKGEALPFLGLDLIGHRGERAFEGSINDSAHRLNMGDPIWVGRRLGFQREDRANLLINDTLHAFTVAGILNKQPGEIGEENAIVADIGLAQKVTGKIGKLDSIDVRVPPGRTIEFWRQLLVKTLPVSAVVEPQGARTGENRRMLAAFRWNLRVLSYIALVVGAFLIYNTISVSVVRRRNEIGVVRAVGGTRGLIAAGFLTESLLFAIAGSGLGLLLGRIMAVAAVRLVGNTVQSLYVSSQPSAVQLTAEAIVTGVGLGVAVSILAALGPAFEASRIAPVEAMARGRNEYDATVRSRRAAGSAMFAFAAAAVLTQLPPVNGQPLFAYLSVALSIFATAAAIPSVTAFFVHLTQRTVERLLGVEALLAVRSLRASLGRTSVLTAALSTAIAMTVSVGIMVGSFRETVRVWMGGELKADFYLRPAGPSAADRHPTLSPELPEKIKRIPGVLAVERLRAYQIYYDGLPATLAATEMTNPQSTTGIRFLPGEDRKTILSKFPTGDYAVVSEPFANKHNVHPGSVLRIPLARTAHSFQVLGVYYDYSTSGFIDIDRGVLLRYLPDPSPSSLAVYVRSAGDRAEIRKAIGQAISGHPVMVFTNGDLRRGAIAVFDRTFSITYALEAVAVVVAIMGIAGALLAMAIDRRREFALIRFLGAARPQVRRIILCEAGLLGLLASGIGLALGTALSLILIFVINKQSFGWTIQFHWPIALLLTALTGVYLATVLAGLYPARAVNRMNPIEVIHEE